MTAVADRAVVLDGRTVPSREVVGNKGRSIAWMLSLGLPVPPALCLPIDECRRFHAAGGELEDEAWSSVLAGVHGLEEKLGCSSRASPGPGSVTAGTMASGGNACACSFTLSTVAPTTTVLPALSRTAQSWILRPSRSTSVSSVNGASGTGRIRSTVTRAMRIGTGVGIASAAHTTSDAGAEPCCMPGSHGPAAFGLVVTRLPSTR